MKNAKETEIQNLLKIVLEAQTKTQQIEHDIEQARNTSRAIKEANDERIRNIQNENIRLDEELAEKERTLNKAKQEIESQIYELRAKLLRRIILCNLKNLLKDLPADSTPDYALSTIYKGRFAIVYDRVTIGSKPINKYEWIVGVKLAEQVSRSGLLKYVWSTHDEIHWGFRDELPQFYQRDFKSEEEAKAYAERNRARICEKLVEGIRQVEQEIETANDNIDDVFDFRLLIDSILDPQYSQALSFKVVSAEKHQVILTPVLSRYDREVHKIQPYTISVTQEGYQLTITGHRFAGQSRDIKYAIYKYFHTEFKAIDADTQQEIQNPY